MIDDSDLAQRFDYHPPAHDGIKHAHEDARYALLTVARIINELCPDGREKSLAITKLEEAMMWANAAIARKQSVGSTNEKG